MCVWECVLNLARTRGQDSPAPRAGLQATHTHTHTHTYIHTHLVENVPAREASGLIRCTVRVFLPPRLASPVLEDPLRVKLAQPVLRITHLQRPQTSEVSSERARHKKQRNAQRILLRVGGDGSKSMCGCRATSTGPRRRRLSVRAISCHGRVSPKISKRLPSWYISIISSTSLAGKMSMKWSSKSLRSSM